MTPGSGGRDRLFGTMIAFAGSGRVAGAGGDCAVGDSQPAAWHGQTMAPPFTVAAMQPWCVRVAEKAAHVPFGGWLTTRSYSVKVLPPPTGRPTSTPLAFQQPGRPSERSCRENRPVPYVSSTPSARHPRTRASNTRVPCSRRLGRICTMTCTPEHGTAGGQLKDLEGRVDCEVDQHADAEGQQDLDRPAARLAQHRKEAHPQQQRDDADVGPDQDHPTGPTSRPSSSTSTAEAYARCIRATSAAKSPAAAKSPGSSQPGQPSRTRRPSTRPVSPASGNASTLFAATGSATSAPRPVIADRQAAAGKFLT